MIVAVQKGLKIAGDLKQKGYEVVDVERYNYPVDAIIFEDNLYAVSCISKNNMPQVFADTRAPYGVLIVNSLGKSIDEVETILKQRCYSPLF